MLEMKDGDCTVFCALFIMYKFYLSTSFRIEKMQKYIHISIMHTE